MIDVIVEPLAQYGFMRAGLAAAVIVGASSAVLSCLLVVRHQALLGDAISHAVLPGVAVGYLLASGTGIFWGALATAVLTGVAITFVERNSPIKLDAAMGIAFSAAFALGLAIISIADPRGIDLFHILFGNVLGVSAEDLRLTAFSGGLVLVVVVVLFRPLHLWSFDPLMARATGVRVRWLEYLFTALLSATVVASLQAVGLVLVIAMLITPGATALLLTSRLSTMMIVAAGVGVVSAVGGLYGSFYVDVASGPAIVLVASLCFATVLAFAPRRGLVAQLLRRRISARRTLDEDVLKAAFTADGQQAPTPEAIAARIGVEPVRAGARLRALGRRGLVEASASGDRVALTPAGRAEALRMVRTHRLLERYVHDVQGVSLPALHAVADRMEHDVDDAALRDIDRLLGRPERDPHGHPIPSAAGELASDSGRPLSDHPPGTTGTVVMVGDDRDDLLERMVALGILPRRAVSVVEHGPDWMRIRVGDGVVVEVPSEIAARVFVVAA